MYFPSSSEVKFLAPEVFFPLLYIIFGKILLFSEDGTDTDVFLEFDHAGSSSLTVKKEREIKFLF